MRIVIQCAASKHPEAGYFRTVDGKPIEFVAHPRYASRLESRTFAHPDDLAAADADTWRKLVADYNSSAAENPLDLFPAHRLYLNPAYGALVNKFGEKNVYILSAGWGLIRSDFLTPRYDITFSASAEPLKRRRQQDSYADFYHLTDDGARRVLFFGGKDYLPSFCRLTAALSAERVVFFNSRVTPNVPGCHVVRYKTTMRTNWHYACANDFVAGKLTLS